jgi:hypothetical protein
VVGDWSVHRVDLGVVADTRVVDFAHGCWLAHACLDTSKLHLFFLSRILSTKLVQSR